MYPEGTAASGRRRIRTNRRNEHSGCPRLHKQQAHDHTGVQNLKDSPSVILSDDGQLPDTASALFESSVSRNTAPGAKSDVHVVVGSLRMRVCCTGTPDVLMPAASDRQHSSCAVFLPYVPSGSTPLTVFAFEESCRAHSNARTHVSHNTGSSAAI
jgi:hypothetical protein